LSVNRYDSHVLLLPEDDAIRQIVNGFLLDSAVRLNRVQIMTPSRGWKRVLEDFLSNYAAIMARYDRMHVVLLIDLDGDPDRLNYVASQIPEEYASRVFVLGIASESEDLKRQLALSFQEIGKRLAEDCRTTKNDCWGHALLQANQQELNRLREHVSPFLFEAA
jgi:hypothetical protein